MPAVVGDFLNDLSTVDLIVELVQNELDAGSRTTIISFEEDALVCEGDGRKIDPEGWDRLEYVLGAGGEVPAKVDGIGAKNHGLRAAFLIGNTITVQSAGYRIDLTATGDDTTPDKFYPAVWPRIRDATAPHHGTRVTVPYRAKTLQVTSGQGFSLRAPTSDELQNLFTDAVREAPFRFVAASSPAKRWRYELHFRFREVRSVSLVFECQPLSGRRKGLFRRTCFLREPAKKPRLVESRIASAFPLMLAEDDRAKVPRIFRRGEGIVGEINWYVDRNDNPIASTGGLCYPIAYSTEYVRSGHGFSISGPFISGRARHSISEDDRNSRIVDTARGAFADLTRQQLAHVFGVHILELVSSEYFQDFDAEDILIDKMLSQGAFPLAPISMGRKRPVVARAISVKESSEPHDITITSPTYDPTSIEFRLVQLAGQRHLLHPAANSAAVAALLRANAGGDSRVEWFNEQTAAVAVLIEAATGNQAIQTNEWVERSALVLETLEDAKHRTSVPASLTHRLQKEGRLPTERGEAAPWNVVRRSGRPIPEVPGVSPPAMLHRRLMKLPLLRAGPLRVVPFNLDEYVSNRNFVSSDWREANSADDF